MEFKIDEGVLISIIGDEEEVIIPDGVKVISNSAFNDHENITTISLPRDLQMIERNVFLRLKEIKRVYFRGKLNEWFNVFLSNKHSSPFSNLNKGSTFFYLEDNYKFVELIDLIIPEGVSKIGQYQFYGFSMIKTLSFLSYNLTWIEQEAFSSCVNIKKVDLGRKQLEIGDFAFRNTSFKIITIPLITKLLGKGIFYGNTSLKTIFVKSDKLPLDTDANWLLGCEAKVEYID